jgi:phosphate transport system substrate-binding protein
MLKVKSLALIVVLALLISVSGAFAQDQTIVEIAASDPQFSTLVELVTAAGLVDVLSSEGPFTVFAPTNDAFAKLPAEVVAYLGANPEALTRVLTYHVVSGAVTSDQITESMMADSMEMGAVGSDMMGSQLNVQVTDMGIMVDAANVIAPDIIASNGVIHVIDNVLVPVFELPEVTPADVTGDIITAGSSTVFPLTQAVAEAFTDEGYTGLITVESIGTGAGGERFCEAGDTDIWNASRPANEEEIANCAALATPRTPIEFRVGTDALAIVVSAENDFVTDVTLEELAAIFSTATTWADVRADWPAENILRFAPGTDSGTYEYFAEEVLGDDPALLQGAANLQQSEDDNVLVQGVTGSPYAVGFFGYAYYVENAGALKILSLDGVEANNTNVDNNTYPLARPLFIYTDAGIVAEKPQVGSFINYYLNTVNDLIVEVGYFPANEYETRVSALEALALTSMGGM